METYVSFVGGDNIYIENVASDLEKDLLANGAIKDANKKRWILHGNNEKDFAEHFSRLRDMGVAFSIGKEWNPAEIFRYYRKKGLLSGTYKEIGWRGPNDYYVTEGN